ncbi:MAG: hypothetical protein ACRCXX_10200 [Cetobacterium sp.]|uniref:hypothetical protein n=1 Tax=Cetobacterium sp. TaxID=2071632 RepID=UPI003F2AD6D5
MSTLQATRAVITTPSMGLIGQPEFQSYYDSSYTVDTPAPWQPQLPRPYLYQLVPGQFTTSQGIQSSNWSLVSTNSGVQGFSLGQNNAPATFIGVKAVCEWFIRLIPNTSSFYVQLIAFNTSNGQLLEISNPVLIQEGDQTSQIIMPLSSDITKLSQIETTGLSLVCNTDNQTQQFNIVDQCQLLNMYYLFDI